MCWQRAFEDGRNQRPADGFTLAGSPQAGGGITLDGNRQLPEFEANLMGALNPVRAIWQHPATPQ